VQNGPDAEQVQARAREAQDDQQHFVQVPRKALNGSDHQGQGQNDRDYTQATRVQVYQNKQHHVQDAEQSQAQVRGAHDDQQSYFQAETGWEPRPKMTSFYEGWVGAESDEPEFSGGYECDNSVISGCPSGCSEAGCTDLDLIGLRKAGEEEDYPLLCYYTSRLFSRAIADGEDEVAAIWDNRSHDLLTNPIFRDYRHELLTNPDFLGFKRAVEENDHSLRTYYISLLAGRASVDGDDETVERTPSSLPSERWGRACGPSLAPPFRTSPAPPVQKPEQGPWKMAYQTKFKSYRT